MRIDIEFARRDDCLDRMVPSDLRQLVAERDDLLSTNADLDRLASQTAALNERAGMRVYELEELLREVRPTMPRDVLELWCKDRDAALSQQAKP